MILDYINHTANRSQVKIEWVLQQLGITTTTYYRWRKKEAGGNLEDMPILAPNLDAVLPWEEEAVINYALEHTKEGYRRLTYMMIDDDVVYLSPSTVYRILLDKDLLYRYKRSSKSPGQYNFIACKPHQQWHTDILYLWVSHRWYFFVGVIDAYTRYIIHWDLLETATDQDVKAVVHSALKKYPGEKPRIVTDNGPQFKSKEFRQLLKEFSLLDIKIRIRHPESNGIIERWHRSLREEGLSDQDLSDKYKALEAIENWVKYYNNDRLHAALGYLRPLDYLLNRQNELRSIRRQKLSEAAKARREKNREQFAAKNVKEQTKRDEAIDSGGFAPTPPGFIALGENVEIEKSTVTPKRQPEGNFNAPAPLGARVPSQDCPILLRVHEDKKKGENCQGY